jgi:hypothetical protein
VSSLLAGSVASLERLHAAVGKADGTTIPVELTGSAIEVDGNAIAGAVLVLRAVGAARTDLS